MESIASTPTDRHYFHVAEEEALQEIAGTLGERIFNIEGRCYTYVAKYMLYLHFG